MRGWDDKKKNRKIKLQSTELNIKTTTEWSPDGGNE
jgi:hypothetical protein